MTLPDPAASRAVLIGVDEYTVLDPLPAVANNIAGLARLLTGPGSWGLPAEHCVVLSNPRTPGEVLDAVHTAAAQAKDAFLVYFAGHGLRARDMDLHLALPDSRPGRLYHAVDYDDIREQLVHECRALSRVVILDCCYAAASMRGYMGRPDDLADLADRSSVEGTYVMAASGETKPALSPAGEHHTAFTGELLKAATEGVPDGPEILDMRTLFRHVRRELVAKSRPVPQQRARNGGHSIALTRNRWSPTPGPEAAAYASALRELFRSATERGAAAGPGTPAGRGADARSETPSGRGADVGSGTLAGRGADLGPLAARASVTVSTVQRYFRGERVAPREFLARLAEMSAAHGAVPSAAELDRIHGLRRAAQKAAPDDSTRLLYWQEEVERLQAALAMALDRLHGQERSAGRALALVEERLAGLGRELADAHVRMRRAESERDEAIALADARRHQLDHARDYTRRIEDELTRQTGLVQRLETEVKVLQGQVGRLLAAEAPPRTGEPESLVGAVPRATDAHATAGAGTRTRERPPQASGQPSAPGEGTTTSATGPVRGGCLFGALITLGLLYTVASCEVSTWDVPLRFDSGRKPASVEKPHYSAVSGPRHVWDVTERVDSTFRPDGDGAADTLRGDLTVSLPAGCEDRTVDWEIAVDGVRTGHGSLTGKREHLVPVEYGLPRTPETVTLTARWDGGTGSCGDFGLVWNIPRLTKDFTFLGF
ncbi:caspase, EACC1-associated type [Streptomyces sp. NBC_00872]|uniref:caspase, EACC1-associated type n=1 Tax=Streptomyces sp. NBC_00872 TaxID=2903686 RepID=UPI00386FD4E3|nr:caspase family protein [Streptomyces sp. NBC_00872]